MERSLFLAKLLGPTFVAVSLGMMLNLGLYQTIIAEGLHAGILLYLSGFLSMLGGLALSTCTTGGRWTGGSSLQHWVG
ncbi:hypothetical protein [Rhizobium binae]|uniref:Membrane protein n=1 Tax=Rhizobium binae TaxID=1138190 RepID=A0ABV2MID3_9HYPH|nr:hypothetical protein [Rhizobium binae]